MGITSDPRFLAVARKRLIHLFPAIPDRAGLYKRREALSDTIEALIAEFAAHSPGNDDDVLLVDSTPLECGRSRETVKRGGASSLADAISDAADYGYSASHSPSSDAPSRPPCRSQVDARQSGTSEESLVTTARRLAEPSTRCLGALPCFSLV